MKGSRLDGTSLAEGTSASSGPQEGRPSTSSNLERVVVTAGIAGVALIPLLLWLSYRQQDVRWRIQGAVTRWANGVPRRPRRANAH